VKPIVRNRIEARKRRNARRLQKDRFPKDLSRPMMRSATPQYEVAGRAVATAYGGIGLVHQLVQELKLPEEINSRLHLFRAHRPYHESDHVLSLAYNALCGGQALEDLEVRRQDEAYLDLLGAERIPDPTTAGDFCRRFRQDDLEALQTAFDEARHRIWGQQPPGFLEEARIEADGTMVETGAECKDGIDMNYKGKWGYHPLVLTLANTGEVLRLVNRSGNRPSHEGAAAQFDQCIKLCRDAGFRRIVLRGDTDFSQTEHLDRWHFQGDVNFLFGYDCMPHLKELAEAMPETSWEPLKRSPKYVVQTEPRRKPEPIRQLIVEACGFKDIRTVEEWVAEIPYRPMACRWTYRMIILRKTLEISEPRQGRLFEEYQYLFWITNDPKPTPAEIVFSANDRCQQENVIAQLKALRALHSPVDNLTSNGAYMLMTALAWNLKAWLALRLPEKKGRWLKDHQAQKQTLLRQEFQTFLKYWMRVPCQVLTTGRRLVLRVLGWNKWQPEFFRLAASLAAGLRC
jgi:hypothetical protein